MHFYDFKKTITLTSGWFVSADNEIGAEMALDRASAGVSFGSVFGLCMLAFLVGAGGACGLGYLYLHRRRPRLPSSPHFISSKQNSYVTVPLKEIHTPKRTPSFSSKSTTLANGTPKLFSKLPVDYETATIKRNSHSLANGHIRADLEQDKFF